MKGRSKLHSLRCLPCCRTCPTMQFSLNLAQTQKPGWQPAIGDKGLSQT